jgi:transcriptional regulator with XRE-family HTH domain
VNFSDVLSLLMQKKQITAYKLWKDTKISQSIIGKWKDGTKKPTAEYLARLSEYFGVTTDYLLGKEQKEKPTDKLGELKESIFNIMEDLSPLELQKLLDYSELLEAARRSKANM